MKDAFALNGTVGHDLISGLREVVLTARPGADVQLIRRAYDVAAHFHQGQTRQSGDPYITHPVTVATILAGLGADDQTLCAAILHDTVEDTSYTLSELRRAFGGGIATMVAEHTALDHVGVRGRKVSRTMAAVRSTDTRVVAMKMADRLHNMQTLQFLPQAKQLVKAREVLAIYVPVARQLSMDVMGSELQTLAFAALIRNRSACSTHNRAIVALDIESSTSRPDPVKAELRTMLYELFGVALRSAEIHPRHRDRFYDRGDGLLALIHPADQAPKALLQKVIPVFNRLLTDYNASLPSWDRPQRQLRVRVVVHTGHIRYDANGCFGQALDVAFRLLDAPSVKTALTTVRDPLLLVVSGEVYQSVVRSSRDGFDPGTFRDLVSTEIAGIRHPGWIRVSGLCALASPRIGVGVVAYRRPKGVRQIRTPGSGCSSCHPSACLHRW
jgi:HD domain